MFSSSAEASFSSCFVYSFRNECRCCSRKKGESCRRIYPRGWLCTSGKLSTFDASDVATQAKFGWTEKSCEPHNLLTCLASIGQLVYTESKVLSERRVRDNNLRVTITNYAMTVILYTISRLARLSVATLRSEPISRCLDLLEFHVGHSHPGPI